MTDKQILQKAIKKAERNGFSFVKFWKDLFDKPYFPYEACYKDLTSLDIIQVIELTPAIIRMIVFSHDFAKAFWGEGNSGVVISEVYYQGNDVLKVYLKEYEKHLQQMVLEPEPLKYIERFL